LLINNNKYQTKNQAFSHKASYPAATEEEVFNKIQEISE